MTPSETVILTEYVRACCPQQAFGEYTPDAWHDILGDLRLEDCRTAVVAIKRRAVFVDPSEIRAEVETSRAGRVQSAGMPPPPPELLRNPRAYCAALRAAETAIADGRDPQAAMRAITRTVRPELEAS